MVTLVGIITIAGSTYLILYADKIFNKLRRFLAIFEFRKKQTRAEDDGSDLDAIIFGYRRAGPEFAHTFSKLGYKYLVVDIDPHTIKELEKRGILSDYGDASDIDFLEELPLSDVKILVSSVPDNDANQILLKTFRQVNPDAIAVIINDQMSTADELYEAGATHVVMSHYIGAHEAADLILESGFEKENYEQARKKYLEYHENVREFILD